MVISCRKNFFSTVKCTLMSYYHPQLIVNGFCAFTGCRATVETANGTVSSPAFGLANYPSNQECLIRIHNPSNSALSLKFDFFAVHPSDSVQVFDGTSTSGLRLHPGSGFSGTVIPKITLTASSGTMLVRFTTDALHNSKGWHVEYSAGRVIIKYTMLNCNIKTQMLLSNEL